ncbi:4Fe-4S dicluster domain-containing protein [Bartonella sp. DGB1]|uniref:electron transfer flavoprotein-ubiquinone oxidoreductase n=1 Tax=Bartonella sp. DGB1 TaxID=3239807 RepID=UPI0035248321
MIDNNEITKLPDRETMSFDVVIVGAGPAGLSAAIRLKQLDSNVSVVVIEKGAEVSSHIISGAIMDVSAISELIDNWKSDPESPFHTVVTDDNHIFLTANRAVKIPKWLYPKIFKNKNGYIISLGHCCQWLAKIAENLGVEIYPGFAGAELLYENDKVIGVATGDMGLDKEGRFNSNSIRGMALLAKYTLLAEGAKGSLTKQVIKKFDLDKNAQVAKYALAFKEIWKIDQKFHNKGEVNHYLGWPLNDKAGGGFIYHAKDNLLYVGYVVHLDYKNPYLSPFNEFQKFKTHPKIVNILQNASRVAYGARVVNEGGWQSVPKVTFAGGAILGCSAGFMNNLRLKGSHNAIRSGKLVAETIIEAFKENRENDDLVKYNEGWKLSAIGKELYLVRNFKPLLEKLGIKTALMLTTLDIFTQKYLKFSFFGTLKHNNSDAKSLVKANQAEIINYTKADGKITFDRLSSIALTNVNYSPQPNHLKVKNYQIQKSIEYGEFAGPSTRYCPAAVYDWVKQDDEISYIINSDNCIQCKTCDIKDPTNNIDWQVPYGGDGPLYKQM